jgi:excisionase family DNA binding protein
LKILEADMSEQGQAGVRLRAPGDFAYSINQAAELANISARTFWRLIEKHKIKTIKVSARRRVVLASELERYLNQGMEAA